VFGTSPVRLQKRVAVFSSLIAISAKGQAGMHSAFCLGVSGLAWW
jgi:hypothetical protein